jgi:hypothetical protein
VATKTAPLPWAQRLGYLVELVGAADLATPLKHYLRDRLRDFAPLVPSMPSEGASRSADWRLRINADVEAEA